MPSKRKKYNCRFPPARIKKIMQADEEVGKVAAIVPVIMSKAVEIFVENLLKKASEVTRSRNARTLTPAHLKASILNEENFSFLKEVVQAVPDMQPAGEDDQIEGHNTGSKSTLPKTNRRSRSITSPRKRGRPSKPAGNSRSAENAQEDDDEDDVDEEEDDTADDDEDGNNSSCDNSNPSCSNVNSELPLPLVKTQTPFQVTITNPNNLQQMDDDYDA
ncbi:Dr1-associated corepressor [Halotydeus destructor]|nr:Dr1-associated corepressor [Halotydeus destructor]